MKSVIAVVVCILIGAVGAELYNRGKMAKAMADIEVLRAQVAESQLEYEKLRTMSEEEIATLRGMIDSSMTIISQQEIEIEELKTITELKDQEIRELLTAEVQELIERYPALKSYTLALRQQISNKDQIIFTLEARDYERVKVIGALEKQILLEIGIGLSWKKQYEDQRSLRIAVESAFQSYRRSSTRSKLLWTAGAAAAGYLGGALSN